MEAGTTTATANEPRDADGGRQASAATIQTVALSLGLETVVKRSCAEVLYFCTGLACRRGQKRELDRLAYIRVQVDSIAAEEVLNNPVRQFFGSGGRCYNVKFGFKGWFVWTVNAREVLQ